MNQVACADAMDRDLADPILGGITPRHLEIDEGERYLIERSVPKKIVGQHRKNLYVVVGRCAPDAMMPEKFAKFASMILSGNSLD